MGNEIIRPIDEETAKAAAEAFRFGSKAIDAGSAVAAIFGDLPKNLVGILGDKVKFARARRYVELEHDFRRRMHQRGIEGAEPSPTLAIPIIEAAIDETRTELLDLWQRLLANSCDPSRANRVRDTFIAILKQFDPMDARVFELMGRTPANLVVPNARDFVTTSLRIPMEETLVSFENLERIGCLSSVNRDVWNPILTSRGVLLFKALEP